MSLVKWLYLTKAVFIGSWRFPEIDKMIFSLSQYLNLVRTLTLITRRKLILSLDLNFREVKSHILYP